MDTKDFLKYNFWTMREIEKTYDIPWSVIQRGKLRYGSLSLYNALRLQFASEGKIDLESLLSLEEEKELAEWKEKYKNVKR
jgi:hypothetical protein